MNPTIRIVDKLRPIIVVGAVGLHAIAVASVPDYVARVSQIFDESAFVEVEAVAPEPEALPAPEPEPQRNLARTRAPEPERVVENVPQPVAEVAPVPAPVAETPTSVENTAAAPSDPLTGTGGSVTVGSSNGTGNVGSSNGTGTDPTGTSNSVAPPTVDRRALLRSYRASASSAIGRLPTLRGTREQIDTTVIVGMHIAADGRLTDVHVVRTSGHPVVDQHVVDFIRGLRRLPPPPPELEFGGHEFTYLVRVGA